MRTHLGIGGFLLTIAVACACAQSNSGPAPRPAQQPETASPTQAQHGSSQTSEPSRPDNQASPAVNAPGGATDASGGGVVGAAGSAPAKSQASQVPETPGGVLALPDGELQTQIQNALSKEPTLSGDTVNVNVSPDAIDVNGTVATAREKQTATRIVQSYAGNKKVITHLNITGRNRNAAGTATPPK